MPYDSASRPAGKARRPRQAPAAVRAPREQKRRRSRLPHTITLLGRILLLMVVLLGVGLWARSYFFVQPSEKKLEKYLAEGTFLNGIHIDGVNVSGMTIDEARQALLPGVEAAADAINIGVRYNTSLWLFNAVDLGAQSDLDQVLAEAMLLGRGDTPAENKKARNDLADNGKAYSTNFTADSALLAARVAAIGQAIDTLPSEPFATPILFWDAAAGDMPSFSYTDGKDGYMLNESALVQEILLPLPPPPWSRCRPIPSCALPSKRIFPAAAPGIPTGWAISKRLPPSSMGRRSCLERPWISMNSSGPGMNPAAGPWPRAS